ncbi:LmeA family phospholipid-binding protein [Gryllotalpicola ginsengisoli]|uniref:LmeA family phospholipid-binding protein n=1 Tax=Gryllotalpicola ginsengisoli TaxID=444608 RepID=UPI0003B3ED86|nr:DUF2993 domain-containing protein [Gryllotalpicola ginsengisoli]
MAATRKARVLAWWLVGVLAFVALAFAADSGLRSYAEYRMQSEIEKALPEGLATPDLRVTVRGFSFIYQYLRGSFDQVDVEAPDIATSRGSVSATLEAYDVRIDRSFAKPPVLGRVQGALHASEASVNSLVALPDPSAAIRLGSKSVTYVATTQVLGVPITYSAAVRPVADGDVVRLYPISVNVVSGPVHFDVKSILGGLFDGKPVDVCIAPYLPEGLDVGTISISRSRVDVTFGAEDFSLDEKTFNRHATCPSS